MSTKQDDYYIEQTLKGNVNAFSFLVEKYQQMVYTLVIRVVKNDVEAEEISQDVFVKSFQKLNTFKGDAKFSTWLYKIAYFASLDAIKRKQKIITTDTIDEYSKVDLGTVKDALNYIHEDERKQVINDALLRLKEEERIILTLYYFEEQSLKEIAKVVNLSVDNVKIKLYRSRKKLFSLLKNVIEPRTIDLI
jgi:RNA polymerase sigma-70 factor (ECF subfamily)